MKKPIMPIKEIGETDWVKKMTDFLNQYDIEVKGIDLNSKIKIPQQMEDYYTYFGGINSHDFMYNLYKPEKFIKLSEADWEFLQENFKSDDLDNYIVFSESPSNDPICFDLTNFSIYLFSHDPVKKLKVFCDFNQYLKYELIELQKLMGDIDFDKEEEISFQKECLECEGINYDLRHILLC